MAWRGRKAEVRGKAAELQAMQATWARHRWTVFASMVLELGLGNYQAAAAAREDWIHDLGLGAP